MRIIASDYDGTLNIGGVSQENKDAIAKWQKNGNLFGLVSGRALKDIFILKQRDKIEYDFYIAATGAVIANSDGEILRSTPFSMSVVHDLFDYLRGEICNFAILVCDHERKWVFFDKEEAKKHEREHILLDEVDTFPYASQISLRFDTADEASKVTALIAEKFDKILNPCQNGNCIDIVKYGMDKSIGILEYCSLVGLSEKDVITAGDNYNDLAMIKRFEGCAVGRAVEPLVAAAKHRYPTIDKLIEDFC